MRRWTSSIYACLNNIVNSNFYLGEKIADNKVRKILKYLPERFRPKGTAIDRGE